MAIEFNRKRLEARHIAQGHVAQQALAVSRADREGEVDGVLVDFRHADIPPGEFEARAFWYVASDSSNHAGFLFPSEAKAIERTLKGKSPAALRKASRHGDFRDALALPRACPGDRISVEKVIDEILQGPFDHPHDRMAKRLDLILTRRSGEVVRPASPLTLYGITQIKQGPERDVYDRLVERVLLEHPPGTDPLRFGLTRGSFFLQVDRTLEDVRDSAVEDAERSINELRELGLLEQERIGTLIRMLTSEVALLAFCQAKIEMRQAEMRATMQLENLSEGSRSQTNWERLAECQRLADANPLWKRTQIAKMVANSECEVSQNWDKFDSIRRSAMRLMSNKGIGPEPRK